MITKITGNNLKHGLHNDHDPFTERIQARIRNDRETKPARLDDGNVVGAYKHGHARDLREIPFEYFFLFGNLNVDF